MKLLPRQARHTALAAAYTALAAALAYLIWYHFDPDSLITWLLVALEILIVNLALLAHRLARRSIWGSRYATPLTPPVNGGKGGVFTATAAFLWHGELPPLSSEERGKGGEVFFRTFEHQYWPVPFENGRQVIVNKQEFLDWLYECWTRQQYYEQTHRKNSALSQDLGDRELGRYQWQARIWLLDMVKAIERNTADRRSTPKLCYLPYKIIEMLEASYPSESK